MDEDSLPTSPANPCKLCRSDTSAEKVHARALGKPFKLCMMRGFVGNDWWNGLVAALLKRMLTTVAAFMVTCMVIAAIVDPG
jgi:hypothetical protein